MDVQTRESFEKLLQRLENGTFSSVEDLLETLLLKSIPSRDISSCASSATTSASECNVKLSSIGQAQKIILQRTIVDWSTELKDVGRWEELLAAWFFPRVDQFSVRQSADFSATGIIICISLLRGSSGEEKSKLHALTLSAILHSLSQNLVNESLKDIAISLSTQKNAAVRDLSWSDLTRAMVILPERVANATKGNFPAVLSRSQVLSTLSQLVESIAYEASQLPMDSTQRQFLLEASGTLLQRLLRTGFQHNLPEVVDSQLTPSLWSYILLAVCSRVKTPNHWSSSYSASWKKIISSISNLEISSFFRSLFLFLQKIAIDPSGLGSLCTSQELSKPGSEGLSFLSVEAAATVEVVSQLLQLFAGTIQESSSKEKDESDSEEEEEAFKITSDVASILLKEILQSERSTAVRSPLLARACASWCSSGFSLDHTVPLLNQIVDVWGDRQRVRLGSLAQHQYFTTLLLAVVAHLDQSQSQVQCRQLSTRPSLIEGVSAYLDHLDPRARRLGMLVAEIVSARSFSSATSSINGAEPATKKLDFGRSMWDGVGDGKQESRVLRALVDGVKARSSILAPEPSRWPEVLHLSKQDSSIAMVSIRSPAVKKKREAPTTRRLPQRKPASRSTPTTSIPLGLILPGRSVPKSSQRPLIQSMSEEDGDAADGLKAYELPYESDDESSSSGHSSDSDRSLGLEGGEDEQAAAAAASSFAEGAGADAAIPKQKKVKAPVYAHELVTLLRSNERGPHKMAMRHAEVLIRRKAGWGGEIDENATDLASALCGLQSNWGVKDFEKKRTMALAALLVASPTEAASCIIEQYFVHQYSLSQRHAMLDALGIAAREMVGLESGTQETAVKAHADGLARSAIGRAKAEGEQHVPSIKRKKGLTVRTEGPGGTKVTVLSSSSSLATQSTDRRLVGGFDKNRRPQPKYADIANSVFIFPLLNRFWAHLEEASTRSSRATSGSHAGAGTGALFSPILVARLLDTVAVLAHAASNSLHMVASIVPESLELALGASRKAIPLAARYASSEDVEDLWSDATTTILAGAASLALVVLDESWQKDGGRWLKRNKGNLLQEVNEWAARVFEMEEGKSGNDTNRDKATGSTRAAKLCAGIVLRIAEIQGNWKESSGLLGVEF